MTLEGAFQKPNQPDAHAGSGHAGSGQTTDGEPAIDCHGISVHFAPPTGSKVNRKATSESPSNVVLQDLDLLVPSGRIVSLLGASGCGKSTLLRVIAGLQKPSQGRVLLQGREVTSTHGTIPQNTISFVFQESALLPWRTVLENVRLPMELNRHGDQKTDLAGVEHWLRTVGLDSRDWQKKPNQLSGGMKMRASIARSMVTSPSILLMDEPFAALDDVLRGRLCDLVLEIVESKKCTVLFVTHNIAEAVYLSDRIDVMAAGKIAQSIPVAFEQKRSTELRSSPEFMQTYAQAAQSLFRNTASL